MERFGIWWELIRPTWRWAVVIPVTLLGAIGAVRDDLIAPNRPELFRLVHWLPDWRWQTYFLCISIVLLVFIFESAYRGIKKREERLAALLNANRPMLNLVFDQASYLIPHSFSDGTPPRNEFIVLMENASGALLQECQIQTGPSHANSLARFNLAPLFLFGLMIGNPFLLCGLPWRGEIYTYMIM